jgi:uncharacterized protein (TIRG00374 family)
VPRRLKSILVQAASFALGGVLLWLALRNVDFGALGGALREANYWYLVPLGALALGAHALRAWRWQMLLEALPDAEQRTQRVPLRTAFYSVMIGYMVNYAAPRLGEVARTANLARQTRLPFSGVLGTVVVERLLDVLVLAVGLLVALALLADRAAALTPIFAPAADLLAEPPVAWWIIVVTGLVVVIGGALLFRTLLARSARAEGVAHRVVATLHSFKDGLASVLRAPRRLGIAATTAAIWACYLAMAYLPLPMFGIVGLGLGDAWVLLMVGSVGMSVPSPGGVGSYHYVTIRTMEGLYGVATAPATAYAVLSHAAQLVLYTVVGFACVLLQGASLRQLREDAARVETSASPGDPATEPLS